MAASSILTAKGRTRVPGVYSETIPVGVPLALPGAKTLVLIGEAEGGEPGKLHTLTRAGAVRDRFRAGDLLNAGLIAFDPARDSNVPGRPQAVHFWKTNPATRAEATFANPDGPAVHITSRDWGAFTNRIGIDIGLGTNRGRKVVITLDAATESADDLGGDAAFSARYDTDADAKSLTLGIDDAGLSLDFEVDLDALPVTAGHEAGAVEVVSASAYDAHQKVTVYGVLAGGAPASEVLSLNGATIVPGSTVFAAVTAVRLSAANAGVVTVRGVTVDAVAGPTAFSVSAELANAVTGAALHVLSSDAADVGFNVVLYGLSAGGNSITEVVALNGTAPVSGAQLFHRVTGARVMGTAAGTVTVRSAAAGNTVAFTIPPGTTSRGLAIARGLYAPDRMVFDGAITARLTAEPDGTPFIVIRGRQSGGAPAVERLLVTDAAATSEIEWAHVDQIELGMLEVDSTVALSGRAARSTVAARPLLRDAVAWLDGLPGVHATSNRGAHFPVSALDSASKQLRGAAPVDFTADLDALVAWINANSRIVSAARGPGATGAPAPTPARTYLEGGSEGTTTADHWRAGLAATKALTRRGGTFESGRLVMVPLSTQASIHNMLNGHLREMDGVHERAAYVGLDSALDKAGIQGAINAINSRQIVAVAQELVVFGDDGEPLQLPSWAQAVIAAAMQCGSSSAEPLTDKRANAIETIGHTSWDPVDDVEEMIAAGLAFMQGATWVRSVTSYREDDNPFFNEMSTNESLDDSVFNLRRNLRPKIGSKSFDGSASTVKSLVIAELERQVRDGEIKSFKVASVTVDDLGDAFDVGYEVEPIEPLNFIRIKAYAVRLSSRI